MAARPPVRGTGRWYPQLERPGIDQEVANAIRIRFDNLSQIRGRADDGDASLEGVRREVVRMTPRMIRENLQLGGRAPLNVHDLLGVLAQPQIGGAPSVSVLPSINDPASQDGALLALVPTNIIHRFDGSSEPGSWIPLSAGAVLDFGLRSAKPVAGNAGLMYFETDTGWLYFDNGTNFLYQVGMNKGTEAARAALAVTTDDEGALFYTTDTSVWWRVQTGAWTRMYPFVHGMNVTPVTVSADLLTDQNLLSFPIPAGALNTVGRTLRISGAGLYTTRAGQTPIVTVKVKLGSLTLLSWACAATSAAATGMPWNFAVVITPAVVGASGTLEAHGNLVFNLGTTPGVDSNIIPDTNTATIGTIDLAAAQTLQITIAFSTQPSTPFNAATQRQLAIGIVN